MPDFVGVVFYTIYAVLALLAGLFVYLFYNMVYRPNRARKAMRPYPNVYMSPRAKFFGGDTAEIVAGITEDKRHVYSRAEEAVQENYEKYDMFLLTAGP